MTVFLICVKCPNQHPLGIGATEMDSSIPEEEASQDVGAYTLRELIESLAERGYEHGLCPACRADAKAWRVDVYAMSKFQSLAEAKPWLEELRVCLRFGEAADHLLAQAKPWPDEHSTPPTIH
jgi:hypothetical protein